MKTALVTYIYPDVVKHLDSLIASIKSQTFTDFSLVVFNDGVAEPESYFDSLEIPFEIISMEGDILEIRLRSIEKLRTRKESYFVFLDADDSMSDNRMECCVQYLNQGYSMVCNDLQLISENHSVLSEFLWKKRLGGHFEFDCSFIIDKNICGLGNTALQRNLLDRELTKVSGIKIADWFIFGQLLVPADKLVFTSDCYTKYKQHGNNIGGFTVLDSDRLKYILGVRMLHFKAMESLGRRRNGWEDEEELLRSRLSKKKDCLPMSGKELFWWEIPEVLLN